MEWGGGDVEAQMGGTHPGAKHAGGWSKNKWGWQASSEVLGDWLGNKIKAGDGLLRCNCYVCLLL